VSDSAKSISGAEITLTDERWDHILHGHPEMAGNRNQILRTISAPLKVVEGGADELIAIKRSGRRGLLVVVYKESGDSGFVITAFRTTKTASLDRRRQIWP